MADSRLLARLTPVGLYLTGMLLTFYAVFFSGFGRISGDRGDARLVNYLLEHGYRWLQRERHHEDLWSPPFFYPEPNVGAYSDILLTVGPFYWPWRGLGAAPGVRFPLCFMRLASPHYLARFLFAARFFRLSPPIPGVPASPFPPSPPRLLPL